MDSLSGSDVNDGETAITALATFAELNARWRALGAESSGGTLSAPISGFVVVNVLADVPASDPLLLTGVMLAADTNVLIKGVASTTSSGELSSVTPLVRAENQAWEIADDARDWSADVGRRLRITAGDNAGQVAWIVKSLGGVAARVSQPAEIPAPTVDGYGGVVAGVLETGDDYVVEVLPSIVLASTSFDRHFSDSAVHPGRVFFRDVQFSAAEEGTGLYLVNVDSMGFLGCSFPNQVYLYKGDAFFGNCCSYGYSARLAIANVQFGAVLDNGLVADSGSTINLAADTIQQGGTAYALNGGALNIASAGCFDAYDAAIVVGVGGASTATANIECLYGSGHPGVGVEICAGCVIKVDPSLVTIDNGFALAGSTMARAWDDSVGSYTAGRTCSWTNLTSAIDEAGFAGAAHNVAARASVIPLSTLSASMEQMEIDLPEGNEDDILGLDGEGGVKNLGPGLALPAGGTAGQILYSDGAGGLYWGDPPEGEPLGAIDLATIAWSGWWDGDNYNDGTGVLSGIASAGDSGARDATSAGGTYPVLGAADGGHTPIVTTTYDQYFTTGLPCSDFMGEDEFTVYAVFTDDGSSTSGVDASSLGCMIYSYLGHFCIGGPSSTGPGLVSSVINSTAGAPYIVVDPGDGYADSTKLLFEFRVTGSTLYARVNNEEPVSIALGDTGLSATGLATDMYLFGNGSETLKAHTHAILISNTTHDSETSLAVRTALALKYGIDL